jgi:tetratricopeptide (TPR) repeat protein
VKGTLSEGVLPGLLRDLYVGRRTGVLHILRGEDRASILFIQGHIVHGSTTVEECHLGECLVRHSRISQADLDRASELVRTTRQRLGQVLVAMGALAAQDLGEALALHVREILLCVFTWHDGTYELEEQDEAAFRGYDRALGLSTGEVILDAVWSVADPDVVRYALGELDRVLVVTTDPLLRFQRVKLSPTDGFVLSRVDGVLTAREVLAIAAVDQDEARRSLFGLLCTGMVEWLPKPATGSAPLKVEVTAEEILALYRDLPGLDHFEVLGLSQEATEADVKAAYLRLARRFHPDIHHRPTLASLRNEIVAIFDRVHVAQKVLAEPGSRARYESTLIVARLAPEPDAAEAAQPAAASDPAVEAQRGDDALAKAEEHFGRGSYWEAIQFAQEAVEAARGRSRQRARVLLARCYLKNPQWRQRAEEELKAAVREDAGNVEAYFVLGTLYKGAGLDGRAAVMFRRVLELKPRHAEAHAALASLPAEAPAKKGLLKKLLG